MIQIEELNVRYGGIHALKGISFEVPDNSIVTLLGANGAGKTSTLRSICGLVKPQSGHIYYGEDKKDLTKMEAAAIVRAGISMIPEGRRVFTGLTVEENLQMGAWNRNDKDGIQEDIDVIFHLFPVLKDRFHQKALTLSGGEQQMLSVSRALMSRPKLLLMDEPSLGLAPLLVSQLFKTILEIHKSQNMTILLVEQNMRAALKIADYGYVLETGEIVFQGTPEELSDNEKVQEAYIG
ncbi:MAG TPA: ABC transporter ATP-binding protein [Flexilinea sp.]|jgi:branched-chain amino acid transport system ATP-binding protein|nr:ABC transporter ATP-binding protein [Flexilinea sp.]OQA27848.1 MAG: High-affinity branched-chain amino acid transport ATP-binding protein LivF [Chloroflexi bacterium ADurb.Bin344]HOG21127.1 ABC transporter ATP-binding protein [Flexilinea sp.]HOG60902.1 ABC transporter ATP-binding protein [Flexilinea sp.]HOP02546.1 ABC transporter ATP-binding protein [Flexilinea sp.]